jgi:hypothetical protein
MPFAAAQVADDPEELDVLDVLDVLFAASKQSLARLLAACEADLGLSARASGGGSRRR